MLIIARTIKIEKDIHWMAKIYMQGLNTLRVKQLCLFEFKISISLYRFVPNKCLGGVYYK